MSLGGIASGEISLLDKRIKACVNIDGGIYGATLEKEIQIPTMFLNSKRFLGKPTEIFSQTNPKLIVTP